MKASTQIYIGLAVVLLGVGLVALAFTEDEARVRQVADVLSDPAAHDSGSFVLIGIPQPPELSAADGTRSNPDYQNETRTVTAWQQAGVQYQSTLSLHVHLENGTSTWTYQNHTQQPGRPETRSLSDQQIFRLQGQHTVFLIQGFPDANGDTPLLWGIYEGTLRDPVQPKPSQFEGRMTQDLGDKTLPPGMYVYDISEFTAGCSSKFLPDDHEDTPST